MGYRTFAGVKLYWEGNPEGMWVELPDRPVKGDTIVLQAGKLWVLEVELHMDAVKVKCTIRDPDREGGM